MDNFSRVIPLIRTFWWQYLSLYDCAWLFYLDVNQNCTVRFKPLGICLFDLNKKAGCRLLKDILRPRSTLQWRNLKTRQLPVILDFFLWKTRAEKSRDYRDVIAFREAPFSQFFFVHLWNRKSDVFKFLGFKGVFDKPRFRDELMWMIGL